ncbi:hypothetical protein J7J90_01155 [Candidatus Micrarchaeota archaeon]|nr:hypothetical protein [Candidatus Micrarchaeota archaeon]
MNNLTQVASMFASNDIFLLFVMIKLLIGILAVGYMFNFYLSWWKTKKKLSVISFYALNKIVKKAKLLTLGLLFLVVSFFLEFLLVVGILGPELYIWIGIAQVISIVFIGYAFYEMMRKDLPSAVMIEKNVNSLPITSMPSQAIREINKKEGIYDEEYIKRKLSQIPVPEKILKKFKHKKVKSKKTKKKIKKTTKHKTKTKPKSPVKNKTKKSKVKNKKQNKKSKTHKQHKR